MAVTRLPFTRDSDVAPAAAALGEVLSAGGVTIVPTETYYGLAADPRDAAAVRKVFALKDRPASQPLPVVCADWRQVESLASVPERFRVKLSRSWPGPLTVVLPATASCPVAPTATIAVRIPGHHRLRAALYLVGPVTATSANRHGAPPPTRVDDALRDLCGDPDLVLDGGMTAGGMASTVVDLCGPEPVVLRPGAVAWDEGDAWPGLA